MEGLVQALTGSFETVELTALLGWLAQCRATGVLRIESELTGLVHFDEGALAYATTRKDETEPDRTHKAALTEGDRRRTSAADLSSDQLLELLAQQLTEVLSRLLKPGWGTFTFQAHQPAPIPTQHRFHVDVMLHAAHDRTAEWNQINELLPSGDTKVVLNPTPPEPEVTLDRKSWAVVAALATAATPSEIAQELNIFEFAAAKQLAGLIRRGLAKPAKDKPHRVEEHHHEHENGHHQEAPTIPDTEPISPLFHQGRTTHLLLNTSTPD